MKKHQNMCAFLPILGVVLKFLVFLSRFSGVIAEGFRPG